VLESGPGSFGYARQAVRCPDPYLRTSGTLLLGSPIEERQQRVQHSQVAQLCPNWDVRDAASVTHGGSHDKPHEKHANIENSYSYQHWQSAHGHLVKVSRLDCRALKSQTERVLLKQLAPIRCRRDLKWPAHWPAQGLWWVLGHRFHVRAKQDHTCAPRTGAERLRASIIYVNLSKHRQCFRAWRQCTRSAGEINTGG